MDETRYESLERLPDAASTRGALKRGEHAVDVTDRVLHRAHGGRDTFFRCTLRALRGAEGGEEVLDTAVFALHLATVPDLDQEKLERMIAKAQADLLAAARVRSRVDFAAAGRPLREPPSAK
jgi:hypothetical protein